LLSLVNDGSHQLLQNWPQQQDTDLDQAHSVQCMVKQVWNLAIRGFSGINYNVYKINLFSKTIQICNFLYNSN